MTVEGDDFDTAAFRQAYARMCTPQIPDPEPWEPFFALIPRGKGIWGKCYRRISYYIHPGGGDSPTFPTIRGKRVYITRTKYAALKLQGKG